jgi:rhodanese-related sulfurtransferase
VATALRDISREELWRKIQAGDDFVLVDALSTIAYAGAHLPNAVHIPPGRVDALAPRRIADQQTEVVVYCANPGCVTSVEVAQRLVELGYTNVRHFAGGKDEWRNAGLPLEGGRVS